MLSEQRDGGGSLRLAVTVVRVDDDTWQPYLAVVAERLRERREARGLTQSQLAERARVSLPALRRIETADGTSPGLAALRRLAKELGLPLHHLLRDPTDGPGERARPSPASRRAGAPGHPSNVPAGEASEAEPKGAQGAGRGGW